MLNYCYGHMDIYDSYKHITPESIMLCHITKAPIVFDIFI